MTKEQIIAAIKLKHPAVNFTAKRLDDLAAKLLTNKKITDEATLDTALDEFNEYFPLADIAKNDDKVADLQIKLKNAAKTPPKEKEEEKEPKKKEPPVDESAIPEYMKPFMEMFKTQGEILNKLVTDKQTASIADKMKADERLKDIPSFIVELAGVPSEENYETHVTNIAAKYTAAQADQTVQQFSNTPKPAGSNTGKQTEVKPAAKEEIDAIVSQIM